MYEFLETVKLLLEYSEVFSSISLSRAFMCVCNRCGGPQVALLREKER